MNLTWLASVVVSTAILAWILTGVVDTVARHARTYDLPDARRIHKVPTPRLGGVAVTLAFLLFMGVGPHLLPESLAGKTLGEPLIYGILILFLTGIVDDIRGVPAPLKLFCQTTAALILVFGEAWSDLHFRDHLPVMLSHGAAVLWVIVMVNAFNVIDGVDGLAAPLTIVAMLGILGLLIIRGDSDNALLLAGYIGALAGFYPWNRYPARIFLGDSGSMMNGFIFAYATLATGSKSLAISSAVIPLLAAALPLSDLMLAVWRRGVRQILGRFEDDVCPSAGLMTGDLEHIHHRLMDYGLRPPDVAAVLVLANSVFVLTGLIAVRISSLALSVGTLVLIVTTCFLMRVIPMPEFKATGRLLRILLVQMPSKVIAFVVFLCADVVAIAIAWLTVTGFALPLEGALSLSRLGDLFLFTGMMGTLVIAIEVTDSLDDRRIWGYGGVVRFMAIGVSAWLLGSVLLKMSLSGLLLAFLVPLLTYLLRRSLRSLEHLAPVSGTVEGPAGKIFIEDEKTLSADGPLSFYGRLRRV